MQNLRPSSQLSSSDLIQRYFAENRSRVLELAAFLDRLDRSTHYTKSEEPLSDHRIVSLLQSISELLTPTPGRVLRVQHLLSDRSELPLSSAPPEKNALGAPRPSTAPTCC